ncbi:hypothetical protein OC835_006286 [Tilletia horrida]|nr:hypothetical protein OC835_006286 [Tilletia horrida]
MDAALDEFLAASENAGMVIDLARTLVQRGYIADPVHSSQQQRRCPPPPQQQLVLQGAQTNLGSALLAAGPGVQIPDQNGEFPRLSTPARATPTATASVGQSGPAHLPAPTSGSSQHKGDAHPTHFQHAHPTASPSQPSPLAAAPRTTDQAVIPTLPIDSPPARPHSQQVQPALLPPAAPAPSTRIPASTRAAAPSAPTTPPGGSAASPFQPKRIPQTHPRARGDNFYIEIPVARPRSGPARGAFPPRQIAPIPPACTETKAQIITLEISSGSSDEEEGGEGREETRDG